MKKWIDYIWAWVWAMIFNEDGKVFMNKRWKESRNEVWKWEFPWGWIDFWETCEDAIIREVKEEFDMDIEIVELLNIANHIIPEEKQHWLSPCFIAKHIWWIPKIMEEEKCEEIKWVHTDEIDYDSLSIAAKISYDSYFKKK